MQSILTKYLGYTDKRPSRIMAWTSGGAKRIYRSYNHDLTADANHRAVAFELASLMGWRGRYVEGSTDNKGGCIFVIDKDTAFTVHPLTVRE